MELSRRERADERQALAKGAAGVEVGRERDSRAGVDERPCWRHRPREEERARGEHHADHVARGERAHAVWTSCLEVIDRPRSELDRDLDRPLLRELVPVQA